MAERLDMIFQGVLIVQDDRGVSPSDRAAADFAREVTEILDRLVDRRDIGLQIATETGDGDVPELAKGL